METIYLADGLISIKIQEFSNNSKPIVLLNIEESVLMDRFKYSNCTKEEILKHLATQLAKASLELLEDHI